MSIKSNYYESHRSEIIQKNREYAKEKKRKLNNIVNNKFDLNEKEQKVALSIMRKLLQVQYVMMRMMDKN